MRAALTPILLLGLAACASPGPDGISDPYEPMNRQFHAFNVGFDSAVLRPLSRPKAGGAASGSEFPEEAPPRVLGNISDNLTLPGKVINHVLQARPGDAARNATRFVVNTTLGLGGIHDPAGQEFGLHEVDTDFGETLYAWGAPEGAYLELPLLGPMTERDFAGRVVDWVIDPVGFWLNDREALVKTGIRLVSKAGDRASMGDVVDSVLHESADSYAQVRLLYLQHRRFELGQEADEIDPYADDIDPYADGG